MGDTDSKPSSVENPPKWEWSIGPTFVVCFRPGGPPPNRFQRLMLRWFLCIYWRRVPLTPIVSEPAECDNAEQAPLSTESEGNDDAERNKGGAG